MIENYDERPIVGRIIFPRAICFPYSVEKISSRITVMVVVVVVDKNYTYRMSARRRDR